jgi:hypothetical protein
MRSDPIFFVMIKFSKADRMSFNIGNNACMDTNIATKS